MPRPLEHCMRILFVLSATLWAWLVGRAIVFGPTLKGLCWLPNFHATTWYRLTPIPNRIPHQYFPTLAFAFAGLAIPALFIDDDPIHIVTVLRLVSEHAFVPMFTAHVHSEKLLTTWSFFNVLIAAISIFLLNLNHTVLAVVSIPCTTVVTIIHSWFLYIQMYIVIKQSIIRHEPPYEQRQPRIV